MCTTVYVVCICTRYWLVAHEVKTMHFKIRFQMAFARLGE